MQLFEPLIDRLLPLPDATLGGLNETTLMPPSPEDLVLLDRVLHIIEIRDARAAAHVRRMAAVAGLLAERMGISSPQALMIRRAASLHDVGKLTVSAAILKNPGPLGTAERAVIERHALTGYQILVGSKSPIFRLAATIALTHHEHWNGGGYPLGLRGEQIPLVGRIAAVADVFDALLSERPYRAALGLAAAEEILRNGRGSHFDPEVADALFGDLSGALAVRSGIDPGAVGLILGPSEADGPRRGSEAAVRSLV